ncbi:precorrin-6y C5,15-methyltransferase (decarboxylating) subunit CbiE [Trichloromonas sp.]|uniref:precorrin-6y C5,15-methyltransferase (decarboxylating) subunit CbiE n=1 Tax=Trichloromonas sp. TaxID=3069249 RepID=UPI001D1C10D2|nr:precorrin-6y C5,15-methyltransferase (decarboxylating) subunit CbiE [Desulfuromonadaceae bacterium]MDY0269856.1 precorrin-6y C5,15-methyltransferase (decarboxylating) subunit CbiE [Trichloromonas sp.]
MNPIHIVGCGPGHPDYLNPVATKIIDQAELLVGTEHLLALFPPGTESRIVVEGSMNRVLDQFEKLTDQRVCILVSGDPGLFSLARLVIERFGRDNCRVIPGISSLQLACARLMLRWDNLLILSAHGHLPEISSERLADSDKTAILAGCSQAVAWVAEQWDKLPENYMVVSCENLSLKNERIHYFADSTELRMTELPSRTILFLLKEGLLG